MEIKHRPIIQSDALRGLGLHPLVERLYLARGVTSPEQVQYRLDRLLRPDGLNGLETASARLQQALEKNQRIVIVGDFDADGATATALAIRALRAFGAQDVDFLVPNRFDFGYGLSPELIPILEERGCEVIITVDNGISSFAGVDAANQAGMDVIITDHHLPGEQLPAATAIVNPNLGDCEFPSKNLAGVGVLFYLMAALRQRLSANDWFQSRDMAPPSLARWLDLVALGTVADLVPLDSNNRILVTEGIRRIRAGHCVPGIAALLQVAGKENHSVTTETIGFFLAPRLNAAGRLEDMNIGINLLLTDDADEARNLAAQLDDINHQRRSIQADMQKLADSIVTQLKHMDRLPMGLCLFHPEWHQGIVGLLASKVKERIGRPVFAFAPENEQSEWLKGSGRSVPGFHLRDALVEMETRQPGLMRRFGGHAMAAGVTVHRDKLKPFTDAFQAVVREHHEHTPLAQVIETDGPLPESDLSLHTAEALERAGPWGQGFPPPLFDGWFTLESKKEIGTGHTRLELRVIDGYKKIEAVAFGKIPQEFPPEGEKIWITYELSVNEFRGRKRLQLMVRELIEPKPKRLKIPHNPV